MIRYRFSTRWALLLALSAGGATAQFTQRSTIDGVVTDSTHAVVPGTAITLTDLDRNQVYTASTNESGLYSFSNILSAGRYQVSALHAGFKRAVSDTITLSSQASVRVDLTLEVGATADAVEVKAESAPLLQAEQAAIGQQLDRHLIESLPVLNGNVTSLTALTPNISYYAQPNVGGLISVGAVHAAGGATIAGGGGGDTGYYLNGLNINDIYEEYISYSPSSEAVSETRVDSASFAAANGRDIASVNIQIRGGSNSYHGAAYDSLQNSALNAWNAFTKSQVAPNVKKALFQRNRVGGNLGGPVTIPKLFHGRDKAFFFVNYENEIQAQGGVANASRVPTAAERQGDFSALLRRFPGDPTRILYDPYSTTFLPNGNSQRLPFPNNVIPPGELNAGARALTDLYPMPNGYVNPTNPNDLSNYLSLSRKGNQNYRVDSRVDYRFSANDTVYVGFSRSHGLDSNGGGVFPDLLNNYDDSSWVLTVNYARIITPHITNEFIFGANTGDLQNTNPATRDYLSQSTLLRNKYFQNLGTPNNYGYFGIVVGGYPTNGFTGVTHWHMPTTSFSDSASWLKGNHSFKAGMQYIAKGQQVVNYQRSVTFDNTFTRAGSAASSLGGDAMASFLIGIPTSMQQQFTFANNDAPWRNFRQESWAWYVDDKWQATQRLTVSLGLRYDLPIPTFSVNSFGLAVFDGSYPGGQLAIPGIASGLPQHNIPTPKKDFAPRASIAYRAAKDLIVRASYGIFYQAGTTEMFSNQGASFANNVAGDSGEAFNNARYNIPNDQPYFTFSSIFPAEKPIPLGTYPVSTGAGTGYYLGPTNIQYRDKNSAVTPYYQRWEMDVQKGIGRNTSVSVTYLGGHGVKLDSEPDVNIPAYRTGWTSTSAFNSARPINNGRFNSIRVMRHDYQSFYEAGTVKLQRNLVHGLQVIAHYTFSKTVVDYGNWLPTDWLGTGSGGSNISQATSLYTWDWNRKLARGEANYSHPHRFVSALTYQSTWGRTLPAIPRAILGGWNLSTIATFESGDALSPTNSQTSTRDFEPNLPFLSGNPNLASDQRTTYRFFNTSVFSAPPQDVKGNAGVGIIRGPGINNWNVSLAKAFQPMEKLKAQFRADFYNALNHAQWSGVNTSFVTSKGNTFGWVTGARDPRIVEMSLKLSF